MQQHNKPGRRVLAGIVAIGLSSLLVAGCSNAPTAPTTGTTSPDTSGAATPETDRPVHFVQILKSLTVGAADLGMIAAQKRASELPNVTLDVVGPSTPDAAQQVTFVESAIQQKVDGIIISALGPSVCTAVDEAVAAGIPVVTFDSDCPDSKRATYVGTDNYAGGVASGKLYAEAVEGKGKQLIAILTGVVGASNLMDRDRGFQDGLKEAGVDFEIVNTISGNDDVSRSVDVLEATLRADDSINGFFFDGPWPLLVDASNIPLTVQRAKDGMTIVSFDAIQPQMDAVRSGLVVGLVGQDYYGMSYQAVQVMDQIVRHDGQFDPLTATPLVIVTLNGGSTAAGEAVSADEQDRRWDSGDWPQTPIVAPNNQ